MNDYFSQLVAAGPVKPQIAVPLGGTVVIPPQEYAQTLQSSVKKLEAMGPEQKLLLAQKLQEKYPDGPEQLLAELPPELRSQVGPMPEEMKGGWEKFLDALTSPGMASTLMDFGAKLLQPRRPGMGVGESLANAVQGTLRNQAALRGQEAQAKLAQRKLQMEERLAGAQAGKLEADASLAPAKQKKLQAETLKLLKEAETAGVDAVVSKLPKPPKELTLAQTMGEMLYKQNPEGYKSPEEAKLKALRWVITKGKDPMTQALVGMVTEWGGLLEPGKLGQVVQEARANLEQNVPDPLAGSQEQELQQLRQELEAQAMQYEGEGVEELYQKAASDPAARYLYYIKVLRLPRAEALAKIKKAMGAQGGQ